MLQGYVNYLIDRAIGVILITIAVSATIGGLAVWGLPKLLHAIMPWLHRITA